MKLNYGKIFILGFVFFTISMMWSIYNSFVPIFLRKFIQSSAIVGFIMSLDNYAGLFLSPIFGVLSDITRVRLGKRIPYLLVGMPLTAILVGTIPLHYDLKSLIISIVALNVIMAFSRSPAIALMSDITPEPFRSKVNGIIYLMGGGGAVTAYFIGSFLYKVNKTYPFYLVSILILTSVIFLYTNIKEKRDSLSYFNPEILRRDNNTIEVEDEEEKESIENVLYLLCSIFFLFAAFNGLESFFAIYGKFYLGVDEATAARTLTAFSLSMVVFAIPAGFIASKIGKKKTIIIGLIIMALLFAGLLFSTSIKTIETMFIFAGICWALIIINSYPLVVSMANSDSIGRFTGYYCLFSSLAAIISPLLLGKLIDLIAYNIFFAYTAAGFVLSLIFILLVKTPENKNYPHVLTSAEVENPSINV